MSKKPDQVKRGVKPGTKRGSYNVKKKNPLKRYVVYWSPELVERIKKDPDGSKKVREIIDREYR